MANFFKYFFHREGQKTNDFQIDVNLPKDLTCVICKNILTDPHQSRCGCRFCFLCITHYLDGESKCCPRKANDCRDQIINLKRDVVIDHVASKRISMIQVKCPERFCQVKCELRNMKEHVKSHDEKCPYIGIGCSTPSTNIKTITDHLDQANHSHSMLLMDYIQNIKSEIASVKENSLKKELSMDSLRLEINSSRKENIALKGEIALIKRDIVKYLASFNKLYSEIESKDNEIKTLSGELEKTQHTLIELRQKAVVTSRFYNSEQDKSQMEIIESLVKRDQKTHCLEFNKILRVDIFHRWDSEFQRTVDSKTLFWTTFDWTIVEFREKVKNSRLGINPEIKSEPFYSHQNGYKMCLVIYPGGVNSGKNTYLSVYVGIMKGEYDEMLSWPMKHTVITELMFSNSNYSHTSRKYQFEKIPEKSHFVFNKPHDEMNRVFGDSEFLNVNIIFNNCKVVKDESIKLRCRVGLSENLALEN